MSLWKRVRALLMAAAVVTVGAAISAGASEHLIDAFAAAPGPAGPVPETQQMSAAFPVTASSHPTTAPVAPLTVESWSLDRNSYSMLDQVVFEVVLRNVGTQSLRVPTSTDSSWFNRDSSGNHLLSFQFVASHDNSPGSDVPAAIFALFGSETVSGSLITVEPNDTIRIRGAAEWLTPTSSTRVVHVGALIGVVGIQPTVTVVVTPSRHDVTIVPK